KLSHAQENIDVLLASDRANKEEVKNIINDYKSKLVKKYTVKKRRRAEDKLHPIISENEKNKLEKAVSLSFVVDLILLRDQVLNAYNPKSNSYEFDDMFTYVNKFLNESDFSMGVFEGPTAGEKFEYSTSVYSDGIPIYLNFPDSFA